MSSKKKSRKRYMTLRLRKKITFRSIAAMAIMTILLIGITLIFSFNINIPKAIASASGDYRTAQTGNWNVTSTWEKYNGTSWLPAGSTPLSTAGVIDILNGDTVTVTSSITVDQVVVDAGGTLIVASGVTLTIKNGVGVDLVVDGTLTINGTLSQFGTADMSVNGTAALISGGTLTVGTPCKDTIYSGALFRRDGGTMTTTAGIWTVNSGGTFQHNMDAGALPLATWSAGSTCNITGVIVTQPTNLTQSFSNLTWNCASQTSKEDLSGNLTTINGDFNCVSTGTGSVLLSSSLLTINIGGNYNHQGGTLFVALKTASTINVTGNYIQTGGNFYDFDSAGGGDGKVVMNVTGDFNLSAGRYTISSNTTTANTDGVTTLNLSGNYTQTGGTLTETAVTAVNYGYGNVYFKKTGTQTFNKTGGTISNTINFTVNSGSITDVGTSILTGGGAFTLLSGGGINMGSTNGITLASASGNIQVTSTRSYNTGADYTYNGSASQVTGDGLPATVHNLTINNGSNVTLTNSSSVSNILTFTSGNFVTSGDTLILGTSTAVLGTLSRTSGHIVGYFKRWIAAASTSNILFPVGSSSYYEGVNYSFTVAPSAAGAIVCNYTATDPGKTGFNLWDSPDSMTYIGYGLWTCTPGNGLTGGTFSVDITATALASVSDYTKLHLLRRVNSGSAWLVSGNFVAGTGSNAIPVVHRTGWTSHGQYGIASGPANSLPIKLIYFKAKPEADIVKLTWATASEINNDYFTVERSDDGIHFEEILTKHGAGNSTITLYYSDKDNNPLIGNNYYRLKQTDYDGHFSYSDIEIVDYKIKQDDKSDIEILSVAPNPFDENFNLNFSAKTSMDVEFMLINSSGQVVARDQIQATQGYNTYEFSDKYNLNKGIYYIYIIFKDQKITRKILKS